MKFLGKSKSWYTRKDNKVIIHSDIAYGRFTKSFGYKDLTKWKIGIIRRCMLKYLLNKYPGKLIKFDLGTKYKLDDYEPGAEIYWLPEWERMKGQMDA